MTIYKEEWVTRSFFPDTGISSPDNSPARGYRYLTDHSLILYPFGTSLSYSQHSVSFGGQLHYSVAASELEAGGNLSIVATLTTKHRAGAATAAASGRGDKRSVLLYLLPGKAITMNVNAGDTLPARVKWLVDFTKVSTGSGSAGKITTTKVHMTVTADSVSRWLPDQTASSSEFDKGSYQVLKGQYRMQLSDSSETATLTVA